MDPNDSLKRCQDDAGNSDCAATENVKRGQKRKLVDTSLCLSVNNCTEAEDDNEHVITPEEVEAEMSKVAQEVRSFIDTLRNARSRSLDDRLAVKKAALALAEIAKSGKEEYIDLLVDEGCLDALVPHLSPPPPNRARRVAISSSPHSSTRSLSPSLLLSGGADEEEEENDEFPIALKYDVEKNVAYVLGLLAVKPEHQKMIADIGALPALVSLLKAKERTSRTVRPSVRYGSPRYVSEFVGISTAENQRPERNMSPALYLSRSTEINHHTDAGPDAAPVHETSSVPYTQSRVELDFHNFAQMYQSRLTGTYPFIRGAGSNNRNTPERAALSLNNGSQNAPNEALDNAPSNAPNNAIIAAISGERDEVMVGPSIGRSGPGTELTDGLGSGELSVTRISTNISSANTNNVRAQHSGLEISRREECVAERREEESSAFSNARLGANLNENLVSENLSTNVDTNTNADLVVNLNAGDAVTTDLTSPPTESVAVRVVSPPLLPHGVRSVPNRLLPEHFPNLNPSRAAGNTTLVPLAIMPPDTRSNTRPTPPPFAEGAEPERAEREGGSERERETGRERERTPPRDYRNEDYTDQITETEGGLLLFTPSEEARVFNGMRRRVCDAITNLAHENAEIKIRLRMEGCVPPLVRLLESQFPKLQRAAAGALRTLAFKNDMNKNLIVECGALSTLVLMLRSEDPSVHYEAVGVIGNLVHSSNAIKKLVLEEGALQPVIGLLSSPCVETQREAALLLGQFATTDAACKVRIVQRGAVRPLLPMLDSNNVQLKEMAAFAIGRLAQNADNQAGIVHDGGLKPLLRLLESKNANLQHNAAFALYGLSDNEDNVTDIVREGGVQRLLDGDLIVQASKDCVQKTLRRLEEKMQKKNVLNHLLGLLRTVDRQLQRRISVAFAHLCAQDDQRFIFVEHRALEVLLDMLLPSFPSALPSSSSSPLPPLSPLLLAKHQSEREAAKALFVLAKKASALSPIDIEPPPPTPQVYLGEQYVNSTTLSDVTFLVEGRRFYAHRIALLASSDAFRAMFDGGYREKEAKDIEIPNISWLVFESMMKCIYTGTAEISSDISRDLLRAADQYLMESLKRQCEAAIAKELTLENLVATYDLAESFHAQSLKHKCILFTLENFEEAYYLPGCTSLVRQMMPELRRYLLKVLRPRLD